MQETMEFKDSNHKLASNSPTFKSLLEHTAFCHQGQTEVVHCGSFVLIDRVISSFKPVL